MTTETRKTPTAVSGLKGWYSFCPVHLQLI
jgi:hypothetical protein